MQYFINKEELISFIYGDVSSTLYSLYVLDVQGLNNSFERDIEFFEVSGRDGDLIIDNQRKKSKEITIEGFIDFEKSYIETFEDLCSEIENWLQGEVNLNTLKFSNSHRTYKAICTSIEIDEVLENFGEVIIKFKIQPGGGE